MNETPRLEVQHFTSDDLLADGWQFTTFSYRSVVRDDIIMKIEENLHGGMESRDIVVCVDKRWTVVATELPQPNITLIVLTHFFEELVAPRIPNYSSRKV